jgi:sirohydrochlorin ferrochelatase
VVIPLQAVPDEATDAAISACAASAPMVCLTAAPLGPHPLLGEALHARLAEAGLAHATRVGRVNVVTGTGGVIVGAAGGQEAVKAAEVVAVLLASRLMVPVACEPLDNFPRIAQASGQLRAAGVNRVVLAPCVVGPEITPQALADLAAHSGLDCAAPLGPHPAIAKLVAIRYGAALVDPQLADSAAQASGSRRRAGSHSS